MIGDLKRKTDERTKKIEVNEPKPNRIQLDKGYRRAPLKHATRSSPCHVPLFAVYSVRMSRKADSGSSRGFDDIVGVVLLVAALLLLVSQLSFNHEDISFLGG